MTGVFTDNQPDFNWLMPEYEEKSFTQYFMPYREVGVVKNATKDVLVNVEKQERPAGGESIATSAQLLKIQITNNEQELIERSVPGQSGNSLLKINSSW